MGTIERIHTPVRFRSQSEMRECSRATGAQHEREDHKSGSHHEMAAEHHETAAHHHREAAKHHETGDHEKAGHHAHMAHAHELHATHHGHEAAKHHAEHHEE